jgi:hypothetical protein
MTVKTLEQTLRDNHFFRQFGIKQLGIFGSFARGEPYNDVDILLSDVHLNYKERENFKRRLEQLLHVDVEVVAEKFADPIILYRAKKDLKYVKGSD